MTLEYLVVGHLTQDRHRHGGQTRYTVGGTAAYSALMARSLGCQVAMVSGTADDLELPSAFGEITLFGQPIAENPTFENTYDDAGKRTQWVLAKAPPLSPPALPLPWSRSRIVHLGPVFGEVDQALTDHLDQGDHGLLAITPQGCMRQASPDGRVVPVRWAEAEGILGRCGVAVLSIEDVGGDLHLARAYAELVPTLVLTDGWRGAMVHHGGKVRTSEPPAVREVDPTGAGDIFAAAYLVELVRGGDPL